MALRLGFMLRVTGDGEPGALFRDAVDLGVAAEDLGYEVLWLTQHHFGSAGSPMPSPLLLLAAIAARTRTIRLGTSVLTATAEQPVRVAEDAAVLDLLSAGRLELGLGAAGGPQALGAFGLSAATSADDLAKTSLAIRGLLRGEAVPGGAGATVQPSAPAVTERMWVASNTGSSVRFAGPENFGLITNYQPARLPVEQRDYLDRYVADAVAAGHRPRVALVRSTFPTREPAAARSMLEPHAKAMVAQNQGGLRPLASVEEYFDRVDFHWGHPEAVADGLARDIGMPYATDLLAGMLSARLAPREQLLIMRLMAEDVMPLLRARLDTATPQPDATGLSVT